jgi:small subunit ribosomal protein S4
MARYLGPKCKLSRREGTDLFLKSGVKSLEAKCKLEVPPGGIKGERKPRLSATACSCARSRSCAACTGCSSGSSANYYVQGGRPPGGDRRDLLQILEARLDNVVYRMGFAVHAQRGAPARQPQGAVQVNGEVSTSRRTSARPATSSRCARRRRSSCASQQALQIKARRSVSRTGSRSTTRSSRACSSRCRSAATSCPTSTRTSSSSCTRSNPLLRPGAATDRRPDNSRHQAR